MFHQPPPVSGPTPNRKRIHQHHESKKYTRLPVNQTCLLCFPPRKPFLETAFGKLPPEVRADIFKDVLTVGSIYPPLKDGISVPMIRTKRDCSDRGSGTNLSVGPAKPASCLALLQTCRQIYHETSLLFYAMNTMYISDPQEMLSLLRRLGPVRCDELRSLHLEDVLVPTPMFNPRYIDQLRSQRLVSEDTVARFSSRREDRTHPDVKKAIQLLNKRGNLRKIYLDMRPSQALEYIKLCTQIPGFKYREIAFESPARWSVLVPSTKWETKSWFRTFLDDNTEGRTSSSRHVLYPYLPYWRGDEKYRVEVDIRSVDSRTQDSSGVDTAMGGLSLS